MKLRKPDIDDEKFARQLGIISPALLAESHIDIVGVGAIGSVAGLQLAMMGCSDMRAFDFDNVEKHNLPNQVYWESHLGYPKVEAFAAVVKAHTGFQVDAVNKKWTIDGGNRLNGIVVATPDTMATRKEMWEVVKVDPGVRLLVDARMGGQEYSVLCVDPRIPGMVEYYEENFLYDDEEASDAPCTERTIVYNVFMVGGLVCGLIRKWLSKESGGEERSPMALAIIGDTVVPMQDVTVMGN